VSASGSLYSVDGGDGDTSNGKALTSGKLGGFLWNLSREFEQIFHFSNNKHKMLLTSGLF